MGDIVLSKSFGPTDSVADTVTTIGSAYTFPAYDTTIEKIRVSYGGAVNAKEAAGLVLIFGAGLPGSPFTYAFGNGAGGATNSNNSAAEIIPCRIGVPANTQITVKVISAEVAKDMIISLGCSPGLQRSEMTLCAGGAAQDTTADTSLALTTNAKVSAVGASGLVPFRDGVIRKIRFSGSGVVDAKAASTILTLTIGGYPFPLEFAVGKGSGGAATSSISDADLISDLGIPIKANSPIAVAVLSSEVLLSATVSFQVD